MKNNSSNPFLNANVCHRQILQEQRLAWHISQFLATVNENMEFRCTTLASCFYTFIFTILTQGKLWHLVK